MLKNIYAPLSGGVAQERVLEIIANNLANTNTNGFKEEKVSFAAMAADPWPAYANPAPPAPFKMSMDSVYPLHGNEMGYAALAKVETDFTQGPLRRTGNNLDLALSGQGFFVIDTPFGERLSRDGGFSLSPDGVLMTKSGFAVQGQSGAIGGLSEGNMRVTADGEVWEGERFIDKLRLVSPEEKGVMQKIGDNLYAHDGAPENLKPYAGQVLQGNIEGSNVNAMRNLSNMIVAHRTYEALQKTVKAHDEAMGQGNRVGEVHGN